MCVYSVQLYGDLLYIYELCVVLSSDFTNSTEGDNYRTPFEYKFI